jgi:hypothetical protein
MMRRITTVVLFLGILFLIPLNISYADNAEVLPKGVSMVSLDGTFYLPIDEQYGPDGDVESAAVDFNGPLDSSVFPDLSLIEQAFGMPPGSASIGDSVVSFEYDVTLVDLSFQYGVTDKLSAGIRIPYLNVKNNVDATLDTSNATVGKNPFVPGGVAPLPIPGTEPFTTDDAQNLIVDGYGFDPLETWSDSGIGDIEAGGRYQYFSNSNWRLAFTGGVRFPTGEVNNPDNLVDRGFGDGAWALLFRLNNDYTGIEKLVLNASFRYDLYLPDSETLRVPENVDEPITANKEEVDRDLGDVFQFEFSGTYQFIEAWSLSLLYKYAFSLQDKVSGDQGFNYESLEDETDWKEHVGIVGLSYSTIPLFQAKKFPIPLVCSLSYRNRFAGENVLKSQYISLGLTAYF